jgi:hypothetical protein
LLSVIGGVVNHIPIIGSATKVAELVGTMLGTVVSWIASPGQMAHDLGGWVTFNLFGYNLDAPWCYQPTSAYGFARSVLLGDVNLGASPVYHDAYTALAGAGMVLIFLAGMSRIVKRFSAADHHVGAIVVDVIPRVLLGIAAIQVAFAVLGTLLPLASQFGAALLGQLAAIATGAEGSALQDPLGLALFGGIDAALGMGLLAVVLIPVLLFFLIRILALLVARFLIVSLGIAFTPLIIAIAVFDTNATVVRWWMTMMIGALITPIVCAGMLGVTLGLSVRFSYGDQSLSSFTVGPLVGSIVAIGGLWLTGKAIRALLFNSTGGKHEGVMAFMRHSIETVASIPFAAATAVRGAGVARSLIAGRGTSLALATSGPAAPAAAAGVGGGLTGASAFASFRSSDAGAKTVQAATPDLPAGTPPSARWAHLLGQAHLMPAVEQLKGASFASAARTGDPTPTPSDRRAFVAAVAAQPSHQTEEKESA